MGKYNIDHTCGHRHEYRLFGPGRDRTRKLEWLAGQDCPRCRNRSAGPTVYVTRHLHGGADAATIDVVHGFEVKDLLKSRGYRFGADRVNTSTSNDLQTILSSRPLPSWYIDLEPLQVEDELSWIKEQGWTVIERSGPAAAISAVIEGRPEVVDPRP